ncbi:MAG: Ig-like domain-containing protein, partial [Gemmatimonadales bacterium]
MILLRSRPVRVPRLAVLAGVALGCLGAPLRAQGVSEIQITPETMTLGVGQREVLFAAAYDRQGNLIPSAQFGFWSSDTTIVRVLRDGTVLGVSPGLAKVEARSQGRRASMAVLIRGTGPGAGSAGRSASLSGAVLTLDPASVMLLPGETLRISAQALLEDGTPSPPGRVTWKSLRSEVAAVDPTGLVVGIAPGRSIVQAATAVGLMATAPVEVETADFALSRPRLVLGPGDADTLRATAPSQSNREVRGGIQWRSTDTAVVRVGPSGIVAARSPGQAEIVALGFGQERRV